MPDLKISQLPVATTPLAGTELVPIVQGGTTDQTTVQAIMTSTVPSGTANGVLFLNGSKVATSGSALVFDGTNFSTTGTASATKFIPTGGTATGNGMYLPAANTLAWSNNGSERMRLDSSGNLGLGVTPTANSNYAIFDIKGRATNQSAIMRFYDGAGTQTGVIQSDTNYGFLAGASGARPFAVFTNGLERLTVDASGNLGLGVTPSAWATYKALQVTNASLWGAVNNAYVGANYYYASGSRYYIANGYATEYAQASGVHSWYTAPSGTAGNAISFTQAMTLDASGRLGIGVTNPSVGLVVSYSTDGIIGNYYSSSGANSRISFSNTALLNDNVSIGSASDSLVMYTGGTERARITSTGNVVAGGSVALATTATDGFLYVPTCAGTPTGTPTAITGMAPIVVDTTNNKMYFYSGGAWRDAGP